MTQKTALVLSGGGMFGAWQAGAWSALSERFQPDLVVGASVGSLNGYAIASGWTPEALCEFWRQGQPARFAHLEATARRLTAAPLRREFAVVVVDLMRMRPITVSGDGVSWKHLVASCAVPGIVRPRRIDGRWCADGGLVNPLPVWAAVELGATRIVALNALPEIPSAVLKPLVRAFRAAFGYQPLLPPRIRLTTLTPGERLGSLWSAIRWDSAKAAHWIALGQQDADPDGAGGGKAVQARADQTCGFVLRAGLRHLHSS